MSFTQVTVTASYTWLGVPLTGSVRFLLSQTITDSVSHATQNPQAVIVDLDTKGNLSVVLSANDDPTTTPAGTYYHVTEVLDRFPVREYGVYVQHVTSPVSLRSLPSIDGHPVPFIA